MPPTLPAPLPGRQKIKNKLSEGRVPIQRGRGVAVRAVERLTEGRCKRRCQGTERTSHPGGLPDLAGATLEVLFEAVQQGRDLAVEVVQGLRRGRTPCSAANARNEVTARARSAGAQSAATEAMARAAWPGKCGSAAHSSGNAGAASAPHPTMP